MKKDKVFLWFNFFKMMSNRLKYNIEGFPPFKNGKFLCLQNIRPHEKSRPLIGQNNDDVCRRIFSTQCKQKKFKITYKMNLRHVKK